jgi:dihydroorotase
MFGRVMCVVGFAILCFSGPVFSGEGQEVKYDLLLKGGKVIDPANGLNRMMDVAVKDKKIALVAKNIPAAEAKLVIPVSGNLITPGIIDMHAHVFYTFYTPQARSVIPDDLCLPSGVTTVVDAGTSGADSFEEMMDALGSAKANTKVRVMAFINIASPGMNEAEQDPRTFDVQKAAAMAKKYPDRIVGFKTAHYWTSALYDDLHTPWASVDSLLAAGRAANLPVMIDFSPRPPEGKYEARSYRELILHRMRPGDIHTHVFARHIPVIREDGTLNPDLLEAQKRGVIFDVGHGAGSFVYRNAVPAMKRGFIPNSISTDLHGINVPGPVVNMLNVMSKFLCLGLPLEEVIRRSTVNPALEIRHPELGTLTVGGPADIAVIKLCKGEFSYTDTSAGKIRGDKKLQCVMTIRDGEILFDPSGLSKPEWEKIPKDADYWKSGVKQNW